MISSEKTALRRGYLYLAHLDKLRPVLVISNDARNELASDVMVVPCTTRLSIAPTHVHIKRGEGGIPHSTVLKCEQLTTLHRDTIRRNALGASLSAKRLCQVERAILRAIGVPVPLDPEL